MKELKLRKEDALMLYKIVSVGPGGKGHSVNTMDKVKNVLDDLEAGASNFEPGKLIEFEKEVVLNVTETEKTMIQNYWKEHVGWSGVQRKQVYDFLEQLEDLPDVKK